MWPPLDGKSASRLQDAGYTVEYHPNKLGERSGTGYISLPVANTAVSFPAPDYILKFSLDIPGGMVTIHEAWNAYNDTVRALKLRDMIMSLWIVHAQQSPNDLKCIKYETIVESKSSLLLPQIFENLAECPEIYMDPAPILPGEGQAVIISHKPMECENRTLRRQTWPTLNTQLPFVLGARKMLKEYAELHGRFIDSLVVTECRIEYRRSANLYINIGGKGPSNHELGVALIQALDKTRLMVPTQRRVHQRVECLKALDIVNGVTLPGLFQYSGRRRALIRRAKGMVSGGAKVEIKDHMEEAVSNNLSIQNNIREMVNNTGARSERQSETTASILETVSHSSSPRRNRICARGMRKHTTLLSDLKSLNRSKSMLCGGGD